MKLGLGTVQFGLDYGVTNADGRTPAAEVRAMLSHAAEYGVDLIDTAALYGDAESVLGQNLPQPHTFRLISKTLTLKAELAPAQAITAIGDGVRHSLQQLRCQQLAGLLVHRATDLLGSHGTALFAALARLQQDGLVDKIGASVYTPEEAELLCQRFPIELIQLPLNVLDQRFLVQGTVAKLADRDIEVHVRSAFLQGLLLASDTDLSANLPAGFAAWQPTLQAWQDHAAALALSPMTAALAFLKSQPGIAAVICGATCLRQWQEIVAAFNSAPQLPADVFKKLASTDDKLIDPRCWPPRSTH